MNTLTSLTRIALLAILGTAALILATGEETDPTESAWLIHFIIDKAIALTLGLAFIRLYRRWSVTDPWLTRFDTWATKDISRQKP